MSLVEGSRTDMLGGPSVFAVLATLSGVSLRPLATSSLSRSSPPPRADFTTFERPDISPPAASEAAAEADMPADVSGLSHDEWLRVGRRNVHHWSAATAVARTALREAPLPRLGVLDAIPVCSLYGEAVEACANASEWRTADRLLRELEASGREASSGAYAAAIRSCGSEWPMAVDLVHRARARDRSQATVGVYSSAIEACESAGQLDDAMELYALGVADDTFHHWHADEPFSLDLHGFTQATAVCAVRHVLTNEMGNYIPSDLKIITGQGRHSADGASRCVRARRARGRS